MTYAYKKQLFKVIGLGPSSNAASALAPYNRCSCDTNLDATCDSGTGQFSSESDQGAMCYDWEVRDFFFFVSYVVTPYEREITETQKITLYSEKDAEDDKEFEGQYMGCWHDAAEKTGNARSLPTYYGVDFTSTTCLDRAKQDGKRYAGVQWYGQCYGGDTLGDYINEDGSKCTTPCKVDGGDTCGGAWHNSIYATGIEKTQNSSNGSVYKKTRTIQAGSQSIYWAIGGFDVDAINEQTEKDTGWANYKPRCSCDSTSLNIGEDQKCDGRFTAQTDEARRVMIGIARFPERPAF